MQKQKREKGVDTWIVKYNTRSMLTMTHSSLIFLSARDF
jgi:hypothetical protein